MLMSGPPPRPLLERLLERSVPDGDCLIWTGYRKRGQYGVTVVRGKKVEVHRAAWIATHGEPPPETPCVLHTCDNPPCWNLDHLWLGTKSDNSRDMVTKGRQNTYWSDRTSCKHGHEYDEANTRWQKGKDGRMFRRCRQCEAEVRRRYAESRATPSGESE